MPRSTSAAPPHLRTLAELARGKNVARATVVARSIDDVAFDDFVFETPGLLLKGTLLERGSNSSGEVIAAASVDWPEMPIGWTALQSRRGDDHLCLNDDTTPIGLPRFDQAFAIDTDDVDAFRSRFGASLIDWVVDFDAENGPLTIVFDSPIGSDRRRGPTVPAVFVARTINDDDAFLATARLAPTVVDRLSATLRW